MRNLQYRKQTINATLVTQLKQHVAQLVTRSGMVAIHDTPFPQMISFILQVAQQEHIPVILLLTEREPREWVQSRSKHDMEPSLICQDVSYAFDIIACIENYRKDDSNHVHKIVHEEDCPNSIFLSAPNSTNSTRRFDYFESAAIAMERHQNMIASLSPAFSINFWQNEKGQEDAFVDDIATLSKKLWHAIEPRLSVEAIESFQNLSSRNGGAGLEMVHL